jgi:hypothetical protein
LTERVTQACTKEPEEHGTCGAATSTEPCIGVATTCKPSMELGRCRPAVEVEMREARARRWMGGGRDSKSRCRPVGRRTKRGPTRASARPERDPSMGHVVVPRGHGGGQWQRWWSRCWWSWCRSRWPRRRSRRWSGWPIDMSPTYL